MKKFHWPALLGALTTLGGLAASPLVGGIVPAHWAAVIVGVGSLAQTVTKAIHHTDDPATDQ